MNTHEPLGYVASLLVLATFYMRDMVHLRLAAIASNLAFMSYAALADLQPILLLHVLLLPTNLYRLYQALREGQPSRAFAQKETYMNLIRRSVVLLTLAIPMFSVSAQGSWPSTVTLVPPVERGKVVTVSAKLENGIAIPDLSWAWRSSMACFVQLQAHKFAAKHVIFATQTKLTGIGELMVKVIPTDPNANLSLWVYVASGYQLPPAIQSVRSCEADFKWDRPFKNQTQDHTRYITMGTKSEGIVIGVSGPAEMTAADFTLEISVK